MGAGWFGGLGAGWFEPAGAGWVDGPGSGGRRALYAMRPDRPLADLKVDHLHDGAAFGANDRRWDPDLFALEILPEFFDVDDAGVKAWTTVEGKLDPVPANNSPQAAKEIAELQVLAVTERPEALAEILEEDQGFQATMLHLLMISGSSHPKTFLLMKLAARVGEFMMVDLKRRFNRARPSQLCPPLYPPVPVPGHSAYPAGHALIAQLTASCLKSVVPSQLHDSLQALVARVATNRLIAGLHYPSDNAAGFRAADLTFSILERCALYQATLALAKTEW